MVLPRKILSWVLAVVAVILALNGLLNYSSEEMVEHTIANSRKIESLFDSCNHFVETFRQQQGRLPSEEEFSNWTHTEWGKNLPQSQLSRGSVKLIQYQLDSLPEEALSRFGRQPPNSYLLSTWRGEWNEYYASWARRSTLMFNEADYADSFVFGSAHADGVGFSTIAVLLGVGAFLTWPRR